MSNDEGEVIIPYSRYPNIDSLDRRVLDLLKEQPRTRAQLVKETGRARTTLYDRLRHLMDAGAVVVEQNHDGSKRGRPKVLFRYVGEPNDVKEVPPVERVALFLAAFGSSPLTTLEIASYLGMTKRTVARALEKLWDENRVQMKHAVGPQKWERVEVNSPNQTDRRNHNTGIIDVEARKK